MLQLRGNNAFKCFRNCRQFRNSSIVLNINLRTLFVEWKLGMQIPELPAQRKFVTAECHAHSSTHKPPKTVPPTVLML